MKYWKDFIYGTIILVILSLLVYQFFNKPIKTTNNVAQIVKLDRTPPVISVDNTGKTHAEKQIVYVTDDQAALLYRNQLDSITSQLRVKDKQIAGLTTAAGKATYTFKPNITKIEDSLKNVIGSRIEYVTRWFSLSGSTVPGAPPFSATFRDSITLAFVKDRYGFLNSKERILANISSANPDMKYYNLKSWTVPETKNKAKLGFGVATGYGFQLAKNNLITHGWQITGGLQFRF